MFKRLINDEKVVSVTGTVFVHAILLILFLIIQIDFRPIIEEFAEVTFAGGWFAPAAERLSSLGEVQEEETLAARDINEPLPEQIELPERRELNLNEEEIGEINVNEEGKVSLPVHGKEVVTLKFQF